MGAQRQMVRAMVQPPPQADTLSDFATFKLPHFFEALHGTEPVRLVAMGSSSTAGRPDVVPYPAWLEMYLRWQYQERFPHLKLDVLNRGKGGEEAPDEYKRFKDDIFAENPSLVIWQVGTNAVFRKNYTVEQTATAIRDGLAQLKGKNFDVLLIDPQYVPAMLRDDNASAAEQMVSTIAAIADAAGVSLFRRWALMRHWHVHNNIALADMIDPTDGDKLHQSDWSTMLVSKILVSAIHRGFMALA
jgi:hypothetical protein